MWMLVLDVRGDVVLGEMPAGEFLVAVAAAPAGQLNVLSNDVGRTRIRRHHLLAHLGTES